VTSRLIRMLRVRERERVASLSSRCKKRGNIISQPASYVMMLATTTIVVVVELSLLAEDLFVWYDVLCSSLHVALSMHNAHRFPACISRAQPVVGCMFLVACCVELHI
jgi:hypothetical protein